MTGVLPKELSDFYKENTLGSIQLIEPKATSISIQKKEVASFVDFVKQRLPNMPEDIAEKLTAFLTSTPLPPVARNRSGDEIKELNYRSTDARAIAEKLIESGFGNPRNQEALHAKPNAVLNLTTLLMSAPPSGATIAERSFKRDFVEWKGKFAVALQGMPSQTEGPSRAR